MEVPRFNFDFTFLDLDALSSECISTDEIISLFYDTKTHYKDWGDTDGFSYMIGYSPKHKFISFTFELRDDNQTVRVTNVFLSQEAEIRSNFYGIK